MVAALLAIASILPNGRSEAIHVDRIEVNTIYRATEIWNGDNGTKHELEPVLSQLILWRWSRNHGFVVADWIRIEPEEIYIGRDRVTIPFDGEPLAFRSASITETHTTHDPERKNGEIIPADLRRSYLK